VSGSIICARAFEFARRILILGEKLSKRGAAGRHIAFQLMKCGTSVGANADESQEGQSKADFVAKLCISRKEARESGFWLQLAIATKLATTEEVAWELSESRELLRMIRAAILTAKRFEGRGGGF